MLSSQRTVYFNSHTLQKQNPLYGRYKNISYIPIKPITKLFEEGPRAALEGERDGRDGAGVLLPSVHHRLADLRGAGGQLAFEQLCEGFGAQADQGGARWLLLSFRWLLLLAVRMMW